MELVELLTFVADWLTADRDARVSLDRFAGPAYAAQQQRVDVQRCAARSCQSTSRNARDIASTLSRTVSTMGNVPRTPPARPAP
jgi:hypothetical protein